MPQNYCISSMFAVQVNAINVHWLKYIKILDILTYDMYNEPIEPVQQNF